MSEHFILHLLPQRLKQQGYTRYALRHRDLVIEANSTVVLPAYNALYCIVGEPVGLIVDSDYGMYDATDTPLAENIHLHRGEIRIINPGNGKRRIQFLQALIVN